VKAKVLVNYTMVRNLSGLVREIAYMKLFYFIFKANVLLDTAVKTSRRYEIRYPGAEIELY